VGYNGRGFPLLWDTMEEVFFLCGIQWKRFSSIVEYNGRGFPPLWDTMEKMIQCRMIFINFKCLSLSSNKNLGKISYLNSQTNPWKELEMENYWLTMKKNYFFRCGIHRSRNFYIFKLK
jgi:hypothetical protein